MDIDLKNAKQKISQTNPFLYKKDYVKPLIWVIPSNTSWFEHSKIKHVFHYFKRTKE